MDRLVVDARHQALLGHHTGDSLLALLGEDPAVLGRGTQVTARVLATAGGRQMPVFCKRYCFARPSWRFWLRASKARREFGSYAIFEQLGIRCAERIAWGENRDWLGRLRHAFILTRAIAHVLPLPDWLRRFCPDPRHGPDKVLRRALCEQLAEMTRRLHHGRFFHNDLYGRNVLVEQTPGHPPALWWIDCPRGHFARWPASRRRGRIKDLAALDLFAVRLCIPSERVHFLKAYLGISRLDERAKALARAVVRYRCRRWSCWPAPR